MLSFLELKRSGLLRKILLFDRLFLSWEYRLLGVAADLAAVLPSSSELPLTLADAAVTGVSDLVYPSSFFHSLTGVWGGGTGEEDDLVETSTLSVLSSRALSSMIRCASWTANLRNSSKEGVMEGVETT